MRARGTSPSRSSSGGSHLRPFDPNRESLLLVARALGDLSEEVVFVGGAVVGLILTDPAAERPRSTDDIDAIVEVRSYIDFQQGLRARLIERGFRESSEEGDPTCRWKLGRVKIDVMPTRDIDQGPTNRWYASAFERATRVELDAGLTIRVIDAPHFLATKLEAFRSPARAHHDDVFASHDLEDVIVVIDGRAEVREELPRAPSELRAFVVGELERLLRDPHFAQALPGILPEEDRAPLLRRRLQALVEAART
ncbi:MAG: hypothetical protein JNM84_23995 [Planctomycetes bacterium]|nr:hypothetical protein [Planctomycetota bacterium]